MKKLITLSLSIFLVANVCAIDNRYATNALLGQDGHGQQQMYGANQATWSPSITFRNNSDYDLTLMVEFRGANSSPNFSDFPISKGASADMLRINNGMNIKNILIRTQDGKLHGSKAIDENASIIQIDNSDLK